MHVKCFGGMTHPLPPWTNGTFDTGTLSCNNFSDVVSSVFLKIENQITNLMSHVVVNLITEFKTITVCIIQFCIP